jgi:hypothetical protein
MLVNAAFVAAPRFFLLQGQSTPIGSHNTNAALCHNVHAIADRKRRNWVDVDAQNQDDPQACSAYAAAIFQHLRESEVRHAANGEERSTTFRL